ncbi:transporter [Paraburkholderia bonniea]|uniref:SphA family protein n=1 Tax=Paraburkholderia bonniea TaxID=2152891 RepID=UPI00129289B0|nr:transporter [Paraburkholderia bonniea]WJF90513.1 transporter [Paraburkholderia bonniea]WJF93828.1 transporter [Paraburkholderia bonniea]
MNPSWTAHSRRRHWPARLTSLLSTGLALACATPVFATEGGVGRPITGMQITPYAGVVPATSDWIVSFTSIYYEGSLGAEKSLPIAGTVSAGLNEHVVYTIANMVKTWGITAAGWNFASSFGVPVQYTSVSSFHGKLPDDHGTQFADIFFTPVVAGYHLTQTDHIAFSVQMYAPTGAYTTSRLANAGQNTWTFIPTIAYTKLLPKHDIELSVNYGVEFYTANSDTHYHNAPLSVLDLLALKRFKNGWGVGVAGGWIQQIGDDSGGLADLTGGARGHSVGVGPVLTWAGKISQTPVSATLKWINEFAVSNRPKGNAVELSVSATFK